MSNKRMIAARAVPCTVLLTTGLLAGPLVTGVNASAQTLRAAQTAKIATAPRWEGLGARHAQPVGSAHRRGAAPTVRRSEPGASASASPTLYVSNTGSDTKTCRLKTSPCLTIAYALSQAPATATIDLAAGTYPEQVVVPAGDAITLVGRSASSTFIDPTSVPTSDTDPDSSVPVYAIVDATSASKVSLNKLTVDGSGAQGSFAGCNNDFTGVYFHDASGALKNVDVRNIELASGLQGCQDGLGVYAATDSGSSTPSSVTMGAVAVSTYQKNGITCDDPGTSCSITGATVTGFGATNVIAQNGIQAYGASAISVGSSKVTGNTYTAGTYTATGILLIDNVSASVKGTTASGNDGGIYALQDASAPAAATSLSITGSTASRSTGAYADGIDLDSTALGTVTGNTTDHDGEYGIGLYGSANAMVAGNTANYDGNGVYLGGGSYVATSTMNSVSTNVVNYATGDGILATASSSGNTLSSNSAYRDQTYDYEDRSTGSQTAGTANTWSGDRCTPALDSKPQGLCGSASASSR